MNQFFKQILSSLIGTIAALLLIVTIGASGLIVLLLLLSQDGSPTVKDKTVLVFDLATKIRDTEPTITLSQAFSQEEQPTLTLKQVLKNLDKARQDPHITAIFLDGRNSSGARGSATSSEIRQALEAFQKAGKKIIAYGVDWDERDYYLTSIADEVILNPIGMMEMNGLGAQPLFYKGAFEKYGIGVQTVRVGNYKSAVEPYTRASLSPENRQQLETLIGGIWQNFITNVASSRKISPTQIQAIADNQGLLSAQEAKSKGFIDQIAYWDEVLAKLTTLSAKEEQTFRQIDLASYSDVAVKSVPEKSSANKIAVVYAEGAIVNGDGTFETVGGDRFSRELRKIRNDDEVKAVVLRINSPGGSATASEIILREIQLIKAEKPVIISMGDVAASGGYWMATGGQHIFADPNTITGSIGVFSLLFNTEKIGNNFGLTWDTVKTAKLADLSTSVRPKSELEIAIYQQTVNKIYDLFLDKVSQSRKIPKEKVAEIAQCRVLSGTEAQKIGLIDEIGGLNSAITYAVAQTNLGQDWEVAEYPQKKSLEATILRKLFNIQAFAEVNPSDPLTVEWEKFKQELGILQTFNDPKSVYARLPFNWIFN